MAVWRVVVLINLALALGVLGGYVWWGREAERLRQDVRARATTAAGLESELDGQGVVRAIVPDLKLVVATHADIPVYMPAMTMGFRVATPALLNGLQVGDAVRFVLRGTAPNLLITGIRRLP